MTGTDAKSAPVWRQIGCGVLMAAPILLLIWLPILNSDVKLSEVGEPIPTSEPDEKRRVTHDAGFSIIAPPNWETRSIDDVLVLTPRRMIAGRSPAGIHIRKKPIVGLPQIGEPTQFLGRDARLHIDLLSSTFDDDPLTTWTYAFDENGNSWELAYYLNEERQEIPLEVLRYLETFRIE